MLLKIVLVIFLLSCSSVMATTKDVEYCQVFRQLNSEIQAMRIDGHTYGQVQAELIYASKGNREAAWLMLQSAQTLEQADPKILLTPQEVGFSAMTSCLQGLMILKIKDPKEREMMIKYLTGSK